MSVTALVGLRDRELRKVCFDALDAAGFGTIFSAADPDKLASFAEQEIALLIFDCAFDKSRFSALLERVPALVVVLDGDSGEAQGFSSAAFLRAPFDTAEATLRISEAQRTRATPSPKHSDEQDPEPWRLLFEESDQELAIVNREDGRVRAINGALEKRLQIDAKEVVGARVEELGLIVPEALRRRLDRRLRRTRSVHYECIRAFGGESPHLVEVREQLGLWDGVDIALLRFADISDASVTRTALKLLAEGYETQFEQRQSTWLLEQASELLEIDCLTILAGNPAEVVAANSRRELRGNLASPRHHPTLKRLQQGALVELRRNASKQLSDDALVRANRIDSYLGIPLIDSEGEVRGAMVALWAERPTHWETAVNTLLVVASAFAQRLEIDHFRKQSAELSLRDALTGLPNRVLLEDRLRQAVAEAQRTAEQFGVFFIDLDRFKQINDSLGHSAGDQVLRTVAERLRHALRKSDTVSRYAGDEFVVVLRQVRKREAARMVAEKLTKLVAEPIALSADQEVTTTASIGMSFYPDDGLQVEQLLRHADIAMYAAKGLGRDTVQRYVQAPETSRKQRLQLEGKLRQALGRKELRLYYQPQLSAADEEIVGMEALLRWEHPELGLVSPGQFIPLAEESGLIIPFGTWILREACKSTRVWSERFGLHLRVGVNLSSLQLRQPNFSQVVQDAVEQAGLQPSQLDLEVTESLSAKDIPNLFDVLEQLRSLGCRVSIDDFGTGQSSLDYVKRLPADRLKIDQSFVRNIGVDPDDEAIVRATVDMAHSLQLEVVAEGVETEAQLDFLTRLGCDEVQGFLFCRPLPAEGFEELLGEREELLERVTIAQ